MKYALITGASKGIGKSIAKELASRGYNLILSARSGDLLQEAADDISSKYGVSAQTYPIDLSTPDAAAKLAAWCRQNSLDVSVLINNAGYGLWGLFEDLPLSEQQNMMRLNMNTMVELTHAMLPLLKKTAASYILNVASTAAFQAIPAMSVYAASKAFVIMFSRGLEYELRESGIQVSCLIPGTTDTHFMDRAKMEPLREIARKFEMQPDVVARAAVQGMFNGTLEIIPGFSNKASAVGTKFLPKRLAEKIAASIYLKNLEK